MKTCTGCKQEKPLTEFFASKRRKDGLQPRCKQCAHDYYAKPGTMKKYVERNLKRRNENQLKMKELKNELKCCVCGENEPACLDFHHTDPSEKEYTISTIVHTHSWEKIVNEINKCVVLCSNCHRKVHANVIQCPASVERDTAVS